MVVLVAVEMMMRVSRVVASLLSSLVVVVDNPFPTTIQDCFDWGYLSLAVMGTKSTGLQLLVLEASSIGMAYGGMVMSHYSSRGSFPFSGCLEKDIILYFDVDREATLLAGGCNGQTSQ
jgi:hypothetical protein